MSLSIEGHDNVGRKVGEAKPFLSNSFNQRSPSISPDGRWLAYKSDESGIPEVYVQPFSGSLRRWQVSNGGAGAPKWSQKAKELFYRGPTFTGGQDVKVMVAPYTISGDSFVAEKPRVWSPGLFSIRGTEYSSYDLHPDGKRVAVLRTPDANVAPPITKVSFIFNFPEELRRRVLPGKN
jgi:hypothetical protein